MSFHAIPRHAWRALAWLCLVHLGAGAEPVKPNHASTVPAVWEDSVAALDDTELFALSPPRALDGPAGFEVLPKSADELEFDADFLRGKAFRKLDATQMKSMNQAPPGRSMVDVFRNDQFIVKTDILFARPAQGGATRPCITPLQIQLLGLNPKHYSSQGLALVQSASTNSQGQTPATPNCLFIEEWVSGSSTRYEAGELRLYINIPQAFISRAYRQSVPPELLNKGETAGFVNYTLNDFRTRVSNVESTNQFVSLNTGMSIGDWRLRQSAYMSKNQSGASTFTTGELLVKRTLIDMKSSLALGGISTLSPVIGSTSLRGIRLSSEEGLMPDEEKRYRPLVKGMARTNARVSVSQNGLKFFEQNVPAGPFEFTDLSPLSTVGDLEVKVSEADGSEQVFTVPYSFANGKLNPGSWRYSLALGDYPQYANAQHQTVGHAYLRYGLNDFVTPTLEVLASNTYRMAGWQTNLSNTWGSLAVSGLYSRLIQPQAQYGDAYRLNYYSPALGMVGVYAGLSQQSVGFLYPSAGLNLSSTATVPTQATKGSRYVGSSFNLKPFGNFSVSASQQSSWGQAGTTDQLRMGYGFSFNGVAFSVNYDQTKVPRNASSTQTLTLSVNLPLSLMSNRGWVRSSSSQTDQETVSHSVSYVGNAQDNQLGYSLSYSQQGDNQSSSGSVSYQHPWGGISGSVTTGYLFHQTGFNATGSVVGHSGGVILGPTVGETFAIVEIPSGEGVEIRGAGRARVNGQGFGLVPSLSAFNLNDVELNLSNAPLDLDIENISQKIAPLDGSIVRLKFAANSGKATLIQISRDSGDNVPIGATVQDEDDQILGSVGQGSRALVRLRKALGRLKVIWGDTPNERCEFNYNISTKTPINKSGFIVLKTACDTSGLAQAISVAQE